MAIDVREHGGTVRIPVRVQPRASRSELAGEHAGALKMRLTAAPVAGGANRELVRLLAKRLGVPKSAVRIVAGAAARSKVVEVEGIDAATATRALMRDY